MRTRFGLAASKLRRKRSTPLVRKSGNSFNVFPRRGFPIAGACLGHVFTTFFVRVFLNVRRLVTILKLLTRAFECLGNDWNNKQHSLRTVPWVSSMFGLSGVGRLDKSSWQVDRRDILSWQIVVAIRSPKFRIIIQTQIRFLNIYDSLSFCLVVHMFAWLYECLIVWFAVFSWSFVIHEAFRYVLLPKLPTKRSHCSQHGSEAPRAGSQKLFANTWHYSWC